eukprot:TRINITY_DN203_c2_g4_i1.p1 TRINITY_DN203_c2_g4~~TRINITY_DN203_c2_g4_i1.p1  ORF type:complete len:540 (+),score=193.91 TRINITY_DN203_c2_g4_i1:134-1753(+)
MLVLFETPAGYALFKVLDPSKMKDLDTISSQFSSLSKAGKMVKLKSFEKFESTTEALAAATSLVESELQKPLRKFLKKNITKKKDQLAVADSRLASAIKEKLGISCVCDSSVKEVMRGIRTHLDALVAGSGDTNMDAMRLGLAHSLSRYKLKFSTDKIDTMIVQAIGLLDDLDKELNKYAMRAKEWYGWHFPELAKVVSDNVVYARTVLKMGRRSDAESVDLLEVLSEEQAEAVRAAAIISMGTEISDDDLKNIMILCEQVAELYDYRSQLYGYLTNRMQAIAPNLTMMVGDMVGARLIAHAGSLLNLAKHPASTIQILGAEKALFRALKTKNNTPKYGLIYHASLVGQAAPKLKGKISRVLAAKTALSVRVDALGEKETQSVGLENRAHVEARLAQLEGRVVRKQSGKGRYAQEHMKYESAKTADSYQTGTDMVLDVPLLSSQKETPSTMETEVKEEAPVSEKKKKKEKKDKKKKKESEAEVEEESKTEEKKKSKKSKESKKDKEEASGKVSKRSRDEEVEKTPKDEKPKKKKKKSSD